MCQGRAKLTTRLDRTQSVYWACQQLDDLSSSLIDDRNNLRITNPITITTRKDTNWSLCPANPVRLESFERFQKALRTEVVTKNDSKVSSILVPCVGLKTAECERQRIPLRDGMNITGVSAKPSTCRNDCIDPTFDEARGSAWANLRFFLCSRTGLQSALPLES